MSQPSATTLPITTGNWSINGLYYNLDSSQTVTNSVFYELYNSDGSPGYGGFGLEFRNESGSTVVYCTTANNTDNPFLLKIGSGTLATSVTISDSDTLYGYKNDGTTLMLSINITSAMLWTSSGGGINPLSNGGSSTSQKKVFCNFW